MPPDDEEFLTIDREEFFALDLHDLLRLGDRLNINLHNVDNIVQARARLLNDARFRE